MSIEQNEKPEAECDDEEFKTFVHDLIARERVAPKGSAEHRMIIRQLQGVRKTEIGSLIIQLHTTAHDCLFSPAQGMPECFGVPVVTNSCAYLFAHEAAGVPNTRHSLRPCSFQGATV